MHIEEEKKQQQQQKSMMMEASRGGIKDRRGWNTRFKGRWSCWCTQTHTRGSEEGKGLILTDVTLPDHKEKADYEDRPAEEHDVDGLEASAGLVEHVVGASVLREQPIFHDLSASPPLSTRSF